MDSRATDGRRYLLSTAVLDVTAHPDAARPELADDVRRIDALFLDELGHTRGADLGLNPTREQLAKTLRAFATSPERRPDDHVVLYLAAHGITAEDSGRHYLLLCDSDARDPHGTALPTEELIALLWEGTSIERLLVLVDCCYAEEGTDSALQSALKARHFREPITEHGPTGLVLIASSRRKEESYVGALSAAFDRAVRRQATAGHAPTHISVEHVMAAIAADPEVPPAQRPAWSLSHATGGIPAFLPNPRHVPDATGRKLDELDRIIALGSHERRAREEELTNFFLPRARGTDVPTDEVWDFTGRHTALTELTAWLGRTRAADRLCVVTGDPGSGKSSLLGMVTVLTDSDRGAAVPRAGLPDALPEPGAVHVAVNASHKSTRQLLDALAAAAGSAAESLGALTAHIQTRTTPLVVLIDGLDEALDPQEAVDDLIAPLIDPERQLPLRLLVGARPHIARRLPATATVMDLDNERYGDPAAVRAYARKLLTVPGSPLVRAEPAVVDAVAEAIAAAAGRSFLVARITARTTAREPRVPHPGDPGWRAWCEQLPRLPGEAMERDLEQALGPLADRARDLLRPLAFAQGAGLPWAGLWPRLASALSGRAYSDEDVVWLRQAAGSYVVEGVEDGGSVYRIYHRALIEHLREGQDAERVQRTATEVLRDLDHPYVRRYLALHAGEGGVLDPLVQDAAFVLGSDTGQLLAALPRLRTADGRRAGRAVRDVEAVLRGRTPGPTGPEARARLRLAAVCRTATRLADSCDTAGEEPLPWRARWAAWNPHGGARRYDGMRSETAYGLVVPGKGRAWFLEKRPGRAEAFAWDLDTGERTQLPAQLEAVDAGTWSAPTELPGWGVVLEHYRRWSYRAEVGTLLNWRVLHAWHVPTGRYVSWKLPLNEQADAGYKRTGMRWADQVLVHGTVDMPEFAALRFSDGSVLGYQLKQGSSAPRMSRRQRRRLSDYEERVQTELERQRPALCLHWLAPGERARTTVQAALPGGDAVSGDADGFVQYLGDRYPDDDTIQVRTGHNGPVHLLVPVIGHSLGPLVVTASRDDATVRLSVRVTHEPVRVLLDEGEVPVSLAVHRVGRQWIVAVATAEGRLHRVDLDSGRPIGLPLRIDRSPGLRVATFDLGTLPCVSVQGDLYGLQLYDLVTGDQVGGQSRYHEAAAVCTVDGTVCVGGSDGVVRIWPTPRAADSTQVAGHQGARVLAVGPVRGPGGRRALISVGEDHEMRCWDVTDGRELWRRHIPRPTPWQVPLLSCAAVGPLTACRDVVVTGEHAGRIRVLVLDAGVPVQEQEFTVPGIATAVTTGRLLDRDVIVVGTDTGRITCWDVTHGRMYAQSSPPATRAWSTALALAPDGRGRLIVGTDDGHIQEWSLPSCRPVGERRVEHRGSVQALRFLRGQPFSGGNDHRLVALDGTWERRLPQAVASLADDADGLLCGTGTGRVWRLTLTGEHWEITEALDTVPPISAAALLPTGSAGSCGAVTDVVVGTSDGLVQVRAGADGALRHRLRSLTDGPVAALVAVGWPVPGRRPRPLLLARSGPGVLEYWDLGERPGPRETGKPLRTPVPHCGREDGPVWLRALPEPEPGAGQSVFSLAVWDNHDGSHLAVHDVARGPLFDQPCFDYGREPAFGDVAVLQCSGRTLFTVPTVDRGLFLLDRGTGCRVRLPVDGVMEVAAVPVARGYELLVVGASETLVVPFAPLVLALDRQHRQGTTRGRANTRTPMVDPPPTHQHPAALPGIRFATVLPHTGRYAVATGRRAAIVGVHDGAVHTVIDLPSVCTALEAGPAGELAVGTRNGVILFD
ncbi:putative pyrroloquinoline-quinone binding quinoprotein [Streptomyces sp. Ag82_O1-15]|uniref:AAA family ATPase n=1 Tax=Streptomyces sp. Ag82_O1-15 TaxID=1938855 RepID=UPI000BB0DE9B|nr:AAA family ATPase [Streptomyces sp. Ag82_O1-15]PBC92460.1 putative pyrroloquinoline-quinone binding quinoprotein [Streptomyces sp. Ag82_O1-15]